MLDLDRTSQPATRQRRRPKAGQLTAVATLVVGVLAVGALAVRFVSDAPDATDATGTAQAPASSPQAPAQEPGTAGAPVRARQGDGTLTASLLVERLTVELLVLPAK